MKHAADQFTMELSIMTVTPTPAPALQFAPLDQIDERDQVRTSSGLDDDSLAELADSIKRRGVLQPVVLRWHGTRLLVIAGHRRVRAARLVGLSHIPAIVGETDDETAREMQFAENVHRENLSLPELAAEVRRLYDKHQDLAEVAALVKKSKPWVSKHLAVSCPDFGYHAHNLLLSGQVGDLELLGILSQIERLSYGWDQLAELVDAIKDKKAGRAEAREQPSPEPHARLRRVLRRRLPQPVAPGRLHPRCLR